MLGVNLLYRVAVVFASECVIARLEGDVSGVRVVDRLCRGSVLAHCKSMAKRVHHGENRCDREYRVLHTPFFE